MESLVDDVHVAVPWFGRDPHREVALGWVARKLGAAGFPAPTLGIPDDEGWVKAQAVRNAIGDSDAGILIVHDADTWCDGTLEAVQRVRDGAPWAIPHKKLYRLSPEATAEVLAGAEPHENMPLTDLVPGIPGVAHNAQAGGGIVVLRRDIWDDCPMDPRFTGWSLEDDAWNLALRCLHGPPVRLGHPLWHLWHLPQDNRGEPSADARILHKRYARAKRRPERMRALLDEAR